jgi:hypothetical protein
VLVLGMPQAFQPIPGHDSLPQGSAKPSTQVQAFYPGKRRAKPIEFATQARLWEQAHWARLEPVN